MNNLPDFLWSNSAAFTLAMVGVVFANVYLFFSIQRKGSNSKAIEEIRMKTIPATKRVLLAAPIVSATSAVVLIVWYLLQKH